MGIPAFSQIGKFITVYPRSTAEAVDLARRLRTATRELPGPEIPFDVSYGKRSLVYYRYGSFRRSGKGSPADGVIIDLAGRSHPDRRASGHAVPRWLSDPFQKSRGQSDRTHVGAALGRGIGRGAGLDLDRQRGRRAATLDPASAGRRLCRSRRASNAAPVTKSAAVVGSGTGDAV